MAPLEIDNIRREENKDDIITILLKEKFCSGYAIYILCI